MFFLFDYAFKKKGIATSKILAVPHLKTLLDQAKQGAKFYVLSSIKHFLKNFEMRGVKTP